MERFKISTTLTTRFSDTDAMGHINNACFFSYFEEGRVEYFRRLFSDPPQNPASIRDSFAAFPFILAAIQCDFLAPVFYGDELKIFLGVTRIGSKSLTIEYDMLRPAANQPVARGTSTLVMYDYKTGKSCAVSDEIKTRIEVFEEKKF